MKAYIKGRNLIPFPYSGIKNGQTKYGITFNIDENGVITANGTATGAFNLELMDYFPVSAGQTFSFSSGATDLTTYGMVLLVYKSKGSSAPIYAYERVRGRTYTIPEGNTYGRVVINFSNGAILENVVFKPMLSEGKTILLYEPYYGIRKVGIYMRGKNLFDITKIKIWSNQGENNGDGSITATAYVAESNTPLSQCAPRLEAGKTYTLSLKTEGINKFIYLYGSKSIWRSGTSHTLTQADIDGNFNVYGEHGKIITSWDYQIEEGTVATEYEPYNSKNLLPYPYSDGSYTSRGITFEVLLDGRIKITGANTSGNYIYYAFTKRGDSEAVKLVDGVTYSVSLGNGAHKVDSLAALLAYNDENGNYKQTTSVVTWKTGFTLVYLFMSIPANYVAPEGGVIVYPQLERGNAPTIREPYGRKRKKMRFIRRGGKNLWDYKSAMIAAGGALQ